MPEESFSYAPILHGAFLSWFFVATLYMWPTKEHRDLASTIKKRFVSVGVSSVVSPLYVYWCTSPQSFGAFLTGLGLRSDRFLVAAVVPVVLTAFLFLGPLALLWFDGRFGRLLDGNYWSESLGDMVWLRNYVVAPFSEEFVYRACLIRVLAGRFDCLQLVIVSPLFFGFAHVHHIVDNVRQGMLLRRAILRAVFQFVYTTLFGAYSAYLFIRTGHFVSPFLAHAFCNVMGFPDFTAIVYADGPRGHTTRVALFAGLFLWVVLLVPLTDPGIYGGSVFWSDC